MIKIGRVDPFMGIFWFAFATFVFTCAGAKESLAKDAFFVIIANKDASKEQLTEALSQIGSEPSEKSEFWVKIANDPSYSDFHRRLAIAHLFKRHIREKDRIYKMSTILNKPTWLKANDVNLVDKLSGKIPVKFTLEDTIFSILILPTKDNNNLIIYLRIQGKVELERFRALLIDNKKDQIEDREILEVGMWQSIDIIRN